MMNTWAYFGIKRSRLAQHGMRLTGTEQGLDYLTIGMVMDIWTEKGNDSVTYDNLATQEDFDKF